MTGQGTGLLHGKITAGIAQRLHDAGTPAPLHHAEDLADAVLDVVVDHAATQESRASARARRATARAAVGGTVCGVAVASFTGLGSALALTSMIVLLGMAALGGWLLRALVDDEESVAVADQQRAYAHADRVEADAARSALETVARALRADGHGSRGPFDDGDTGRLVCPVCAGPCRYTAALDPPVPALQPAPAPDPVPGMPRQAHRRHRRAGQVSAP